MLRLHRRNQIEFLHRRLTFDRLDVEIDDRAAVELEAVGGSNAYPGGLPDRLDQNVSGPAFHHFEADVLPRLNLAATGEFQFDRGGE